MIMKRSRMSRTMKPRVHKTLHFKTKLRRALGHIAEEIGEPVHKLESKFMKEFHKLPWKKQIALENGIAVGGTTSALVAIGAFIPAVLPMSAIPAGVSVGMQASERLQRRFEKRKLKEMDLE